MTQTTTDVVDACPSIQAASNSEWARSEVLRDSFARRIEETANNLRVRVLVSRSQPGVYPSSIRMTAWWPVDEDASAVVTERHELSISIDPNPYLTHPIEFDVKLIAKDRLRAFRDWRLDERDVAALTSYVLGRGPEPAVLKDAARRTLWAGLPILSAFVEQNKLIAAARPKRITGPNLLGFGGLAMGALGFAATSSLPSSVATLMMFAGVSMLVAGGIWASRRPHVYSLVKRPTTDPRYLFLVDSWHTSVPGVGANFADLVSRIERAVWNLDASIAMAWETHQFRTPYGYEERNRITLTKGQAVVHVHMYPFAQDAFIGWDGFLNWSRWAETQPVSISVQDGNRVEFRNLTVAHHSPTEFDLVEFNALSELVHRRMITEVQAFLRERHIEAELDFTIIRGSRDTALSAGRSAVSGSGQAPRRTWRDAINLSRRSPQG